MTGKRMGKDFTGDVEVPSHKKQKIEQIESVSGDIASDVTNVAINGN